MGSIENGFRLPSFGPFLCGSTVQHTCFTGFEMHGAAIVQCTPSGVFSDARPACEGEGQRV